MLLNMMEWHYMCFEIHSENDGFTFNNIKLLNSCEKKTLGVISDNELKFDPNIRSTSKKV